MFIVVAVVVVVVAAAVGPFVPAKFFGKVILLSFLGGRKPAAARDTIMSSICP